MIAQSALVGPHPRRIAGALGASCSPAPLGNCTEVLDTASPSQSHEQAKVSDAILTESTSCSGRRHISKTSCSISGPTSTTIARIPHGKGKRRIRPCHEQSRIPARFDGNHTVGPSIRHRWLPDFSKIRARYGIWSTSANLPRNQPVFLHRSVLRGSGRFTATWCVPKGRLTFTARLPTRCVTSRGEKISYAVPLL
jgi:hypothetical protein